MTETSQAAPKPGPVVAIGLSADGLGAIRTILSGLPAGLDAPVLIVMHRGPQQVSRLPQVIGRHCALPVKEGAPRTRSRRDTCTWRPPMRISWSMTGSSGSTGPRK
jgi:two-component system chemotaxis response regulator CheB